MIEEIAKKYFLSSKDVAELFRCSPYYARKIMKDVNQDLEKQGYETVNGRVLAAAVFRKFGMEQMFELRRKYGLSK